MRRLCVLGLTATIGCGWNYTPTDNILPDSNADETGTSGELPPDLGDVGDDYPITYRLGCIDIQRLGDADESVFQVATLQTTWAGDIANFKLNILIDLLSLDEASGQGTISVRSGVGMNWSDQCTQVDTESSEFPVAYESMVTAWVPSEAEGECSTPGDSGGSGTYTLELAGTDVIYIYAEDDDGTPFNCTLDPSPEAIPIYGLSAHLTSSEDRNDIAGTLTGCMALADAQNICSCLSICNGNEHPMCPGCPGGAVPLGLLLGGINSTPHCTDLIGAEAYDIELRFTARRLASTPQTCG